MFPFMPLCGPSCSACLRVQPRACRLSLLCRSAGGRSGRTTNCVAAPAAQPLTPRRTKNPSSARGPLTGDRNDTPRIGNKRREQPTPKQNASECPFNHPASKIPTRKSKLPPIQQYHHHPHHPHATSPHHTYIQFLSLDDLFEHLP